MICTSVTNCTGVTIHYSAHARLYTLACVHIACNCDTGIDSLELNNVQSCSWLNRNCWSVHMRGGACVPRTLTGCRIIVHSALGSVAVEFDLYRSADSHDQLPWLCLALVHMIWCIRNIRTCTCTYNIMSSWWAVLQPYCVSHSRHA